LLDEHAQHTVIGGLQQGSRDAWATLYENYSVDVWRYAARLLGPDAAAVADVVQESFLEAAASARKFDPTRGSIWSWLTGIVHHRVSAHWRQSAQMTRLRQVAASVWPDAQNSQNNGQQGETAIQQREVADSVRVVLSRLPAEYAALLTAKYLDDRSLLELAGEWSSSVEAIKSKLARARREFRTTFERLAGREASAAPE
jgi:RNA polymerase sigma-70 factor (ECF subfamily)